ncbi:hypothetical protein RhiJN_07515 [Ceratobasidium sp. AG-Ba]|nr:hypothetical protein RhiJN_07515 [Ceratobasidium sp. AG-Ba]
MHLRLSSYFKLLLNLRNPLEPHVDVENGSIDAPLTPTKSPQTTAIESFKGRLVSSTDALLWIQEYVKSKGATAAEGEVTDASKAKSKDPKNDWSFHSTSSGGAYSASGYLYNEKHGLIAVHNILQLDIATLLKDLRSSSNCDEYTEIVVIKQKKPHLSSVVSGQDWEFCMIDHFNRRFLTQEQFGNMDKGFNRNDILVSEQCYRKWMELAARGDSSHYYKPSNDNKKTCLGRKIAQQIVWDYQTGHVVKDIDIEGAFSLSDCSSLLSALQKKRVTDKQCQKMIKAVIQRFLQAIPVDQRPHINQNFNAKYVIACGGPLVEFGMTLCYIAWMGPLLQVPFTYFRRLQLLSSRADKGEYVPDLWKVFIKSLLKEWTDLNIILALILAANVSFLALPGTSEDVPEGKPLGLVDVSRAAGIISMFMTMSGLLTSLCLIWIHAPLLGTGGFDAYRYIIGPSYELDTTSKHLVDRNSFMQIVSMASYLGMPLVLLLWSVIAFVVSATTWIFLFSAVSTQITTAVAYYVGRKLVLKNAPRPTGPDTSCLSISVDSDFFTVIVYAYTRVP